MHNANKQIFKKRMKLAAIVCQYLSLGSLISINSNFLYFPWQPTIDFIELLIVELLLLLVLFWFHNCNV